MQCTWDSLYLTNWDAGTAIITIRGLCYPQLVTGALMMPLQQCHAGRAAIVQKLADPVPVFAWGWCPSNSASLPPPPPVRIPSGTRPIRSAGFRAPQRVWCRAW